MNELHDDSMGKLEHDLNEKIREAIPVQLHLFDKPEAAQHPKLAQSKTLTSHDFSKGPV